MIRTPAALLMVLCLLVTAPSASAAESVFIDRVVVRFEAPELGGALRPGFIFERTLAFEARLEALVEAQRGVKPAAAPYEQRHLRAALERHVTERILEQLPIEPRTHADELRRRSIATWLVIEQQVGGRQNLLDAAYAEGMENDDVEELILRRTRASLYLDRMVAPMLNPSTAVLREVLRTESTPFRGQPFDDVAPQLRRWYVAERLAAAQAAFFRSARSRIKVVVLHDELGIE